MRAKLIFCGSIIAMTSSYALEEAPWFGEVYSFYLHSDFAYSQYSRIDHAKKQPSYAYNNYLTEFALGFTPAEKIDVEIEANLARTPHQTYGFRSAALQLRYLFWDDIAGDLASIAFGLNTRAVAGRSVADVSSPYASYWNGEATLSIGKEFLKDSDWKLRGYVLGSVGLANHGSFWDRCYGALQGRFLSSQALKIFTSGYFGYGSQETVDISNFSGWGFIRHRSVDVGAEYSYFFELWGTLSVSYACRVLAISYPKGEQTFQISYQLPFSLF
jgi:hypothetical protein